MNLIMKFKYMVVIIIGSLYIIMSTLEALTSKNKCIICI